MATVGTQLAEPETGWQRFDDTDSNISYKGFSFGGVDNNCYGGGFKESKVANDTAKFDFIGTKLRIISIINTNRSKNIVIKIDNVAETFSENYPSFAYKTLVYEKTGLSNQLHSVIITTTNTDMCDIDAIDIDDTGQLKPYNPIFGKYLIKQNNQYYSIKPEFYQDGQFTPLVLSGGDKPNDDDYNNQGFDDVNILCTDMTIGEETFKPIDKVDNQFQIKKYIPNS